MDFRELISGERHGFAATLLRTGLGVLEIPYAAIVATRNLCYDNGLFRTRRPAVPTVSVGNLTLGGTGKTPMVAWLVQFFLDQGRRPGIISRGYGKTTDGVNDEFLELAFRFPSVPHRQNPNRVAAAEEFLRNGDADILILDDAFQHRRIARDWDIVLLDATEPFGFDRIFPRGTLRESIKSLRRADAVLLSRADRISDNERRQIRERVRSLAPDVLWGETAHVPCSLVSPSRQKSGVTELSSKRILGFCGIGNPAAFRATLEHCGAEVVDLAAFPDHHRFTADDRERLAETAVKLGVDGTVCTMKDLVKLGESDELGGKPLRAVAVQTRFLDGETQFREMLRGF